MVNELKNKDYFARKLIEAGLSNSIICLHASFKSVGEVSLGAGALIDAFLDIGCTLVCPSFFYQSQTFPSGLNYERNGIDYSTLNEMHPTNYFGGNDQIESSMGIIPKLLLKHDLSIRTGHPTNSFVILGRDNTKLLQQQSELNVYSVYKNIYAHNNSAFIMLIGTDFTSCTPIHFAEELSGRSLFRRWALNNGVVTEVEEGSCSDGFEALRCCVRDIEHLTKVGKAEVRIYKFNDFINRMVQTISSKPSMTHCGNAQCQRCNDMVSGGRCA